LPLSRAGLCSFQVLRTAPTVPDYYYPMQEMNPNYSQEKEFYHFKVKRDKYVMLVPDILGANAAHDKKYQWEGMIK
jgi:hypothetical protein